MIFPPNPRRGIQSPYKLICRQSKKNKNMKVQKMVLQYRQKKNYLIQVQVYHIFQQCKISGFIKKNIRIFPEWKRWENLLTFNHHKKMSLFNISHFDNASVFILTLSIHLLPCIKVKQTLYCTILHNNSILEDSLARNDIQ